MNDIQRRIRRERRTAPAMWTAVTMAMAATATAGVALIALAGGQWIFFAIMAAATLILFGGAYGLYRMNQSITSDPALQRDITRVRRVKYRSAYRNRPDPRS